MTTFILYSQNNIKQILKSFEVKICDNPQRLILIEYDDNSYNGLIISSVYRRKNSKQVVDTLNLSQQKAKELITELKKRKIETLKREQFRTYNSAKKEYGILTTLHGCSTNFIIRKGNESLNFGFNTINALVENPNINPERIKAQKIINYLKKEIDFDLNWDAFLCRALKRNKWYYYYNGRQIRFKGNFCNQ